MISAALQVANTLALMRIAAEADLVEAGVPPAAITYGEAPSYGYSNAVPALYVCGELAWFCEWSFADSETFYLDPFWMCPWLTHEGSAAAWVRLNKSLWESVKEAV